ncbi:hypothetical protein H0H81_005683 [Sphagnurus paluster]|uniref:Endo-1,5-alpha-L-arabinanase A n=1 Tax=Sphagnurus paluster TaxID=117069 RepID=A0A9P7FVN8_9AGAR|nr:hypothetical protein H0H81_005683 [Sphagnurus paluster]
MSGQQNWGKNRVAHEHLRPARRGIGNQASGILNRDTTLAVATAVGAVGPGVVTGNTAVHDPTMCKDKNGKYFVFSTAPGLEIRTSTDRTAWTLAGKVWPNGASWTDAYTGTSNGNLWAPDCTYINGVFWLYYSASSFGSQKSAIFLAKSTTGLPGSWSNEGLITSTSSSNNYNAIDPNVDPSTGKLTSNTPTALAQRTTASGAVEASAVYHFGNYYYLFTSWDKCCSGTSSTYNIRVGRSSNPNGGFVDKAGVALTAGGGTLVLASAGNIIGPGGQDLMTDGDGPIIVYHYYTSTGSFARLLEWLAGAYDMHHIFRCSLKKHA